MLSILGFLWKFGPKQNVVMLQKHSLNSSYQQLSRKTLSMAPGCLRFGGFHTLVAFFSPTMFLMAFWFCLQIKKPQLSERH